jgi:hypothetical protein
MWEDAYEECWVEVTWLYFPSNTRIGRLPSHLPGELFLSDHMDSNTIDSIQGKVTLLPLHEWEAMRDACNGGEWPPKDVFVCRGWYDVHTRLFRQFPHGANLPPPTSKITAADSVASRAQSAESPASTCVTSVLEASPFERATRQLQLAAIPDRVPCREDERKRITDFVSNGIRSGAARSALYVAGMPGTGKTITVRETLRHLRDEHDKGALPSFDEVWINALSLSRPQQLYSTLWTALSGRSAPPMKAAQLLEARFNSPATKRKPAVIVIDELDSLVTRKQTVLYNLFDWPSRRHARLVIIGIANTMDLPERLLPRVYSRLGLERILFRPYTREQIRSIVSDRLTGLEVFHKDAVEMAARKVSSLSGDVRRALHICRRAAEIAAARYAKPEAHIDDVVDHDGEEDDDDDDEIVLESSKILGRQQVKVADIQAAAAELRATRHISALEGASLWEKVLMLAAQMHMEMAQSTAAPLGSVHRRMCTMLRSHLGWIGDQLPTLDEAAEMASRLHDQRLLVAASASRGSRELEVRLGMQSDDVPFGLKSDPVVSKMMIN